MNDYLKLSIVSVSPSSVGASSFILLLQSEEFPNLRFPIVIGNQEAQAISVYLEQIQTSRPLTHDLFIQVIEKSNLDLNRVLITDFKEGIFYAKIEFFQDGVLIELDARPSDSIALALRAQKNIYIKESLLKSICIPDEEEEEMEEDLSFSVDIPVYQPSNISLADLEDLLQKALLEENYEEAARLRDQIEVLNNQK
ncbi:bifunctional nuclease domain-containing protein [Aquirufa ecclesiirivi]|uniref:Bifunctional nuclease family protein n=1 Tax=Aquirufa ecclesiirivi TaxID=2715124 RepID=A0ABT4JEL4_9BACT|nr:bifunctional nuclease family protein [Aquirufa ecclesiirivi]MCZ2472113.1 bifunctional nuclease family protein [Aquirufa ecclesiirivi]MCZ2474209.1 bifunctional nuclease family protein [Aquirufa ecclesiirivi]MDF0693821.1 bifunctional nuclease family protein [Aquirufa ecclesiirivi]NHC48499.1 bifunctional nuclease family protein [Aquirufa ecclesiirivi]